MGDVAARWLRRLRRLVVPALIVGLLTGYLAALPSAWIYASTADDRSTPDRVRPAPVALVFGAGLYHGRPSPFLAGRLDLTVRLVQLGKVRAVLVTGDNGRTGYDEPTAMRDYLVAHGVPARRIVLDYAGFDTWDSCVRARRIFAATRVIVITQRFHLPRAVALCKAAGIETSGVGHDSTAMAADVTRDGYIREVFASYKAMADIFGHPRPRFLGPQEPGLHQALAN
jgi:vancomycin permeability regulator SanA